MRTNHHYTDKTHFFRTDDGERQVVITSKLPDGAFEAVMIEGLPDDYPELQGIGETRLEAIANLQGLIEVVAWEKS